MSCCLAEFDFTANSSISWDGCFEVLFLMGLSVNLIECQHHLNTNFMQSFQERAKLGMEKLSKQSHTNSEKARKQIQRLKEQSTAKSKKTTNQLWVNLT